MKRRGSVYGWLVAGLVVLMAMIVSLTLMSVVSMVDLRDPQFQPVPVPTPPLAKLAGPRMPAAIAQRPAPVPIPTPADSRAMSQGRGIQASAPVLLGLPALVGVAMAALRFRTDLPLEREALASHRADTPCREYG